MTSIGPITKDARALYDVLKELFSNEDDINGGDLVEFLGLVMTKPPGTWCIKKLAGMYLK